MYRTKLLNEANISDQYASETQLVITAVVVIGLFGICRYVVELIWMQTFAICVTYSTNLSRGVPLLIMKWMPGRAKVISVRGE